LPDPDKEDPVVAKSLPLERLGGASGSGGGFKVMFDLNITFGESLLLAKALGMIDL